MLNWLFNSLLSATLLPVHLTDHKPAGNIIPLQQFSNSGDLQPPRDIWQNLDTFFVATCMQRGYCQNLVARDWRYYQTPHYAQDCSPSTPPKQNTSSDEEDKLPSQIASLRFLQHAIYIANARQQSTLQIVGTLNVEMMN